LTALCGHVFVLPAILMVGYPLIAINAILHGVIVTFFSDVKTRGGEKIR
jgi:hypothetical protein